MKNFYTAALIAAAALAVPAQAEEATLALGDFDNTTEILEGGLPSEKAFPVNYYYKNSGGQMLYPNSVVKEIADRNGKITKIEFRYKDTGYFYGSEIAATVNMWGQGTDLTEIPLNDSKKASWIEYSTASAASTDAPFEPAYYEQDFNFTLTFANPIQLTPGQGLLLTASSTCDGTCDTGEDFECYGFNPVGTGSGPAAASFFASDSQTFADSYAAGGVHQEWGRWLPVIKITYTWEDAPEPVVCETPVIEPASGSKFGPETLFTITSATEDAQIYYTLTKDADPDILYDGPFTLSEGVKTTITAKAVKDGCTDSETASASFDPAFAKMPAFKIPSGTMLGANEPVVITAAEGASILYTLDATAEPDLAYPAEGILLSADATVKAIAKAENQWPSSPEQASYTINELNATNLGDFWASADDEENLFIGTNWYNAPIIPTYANSASQLLYLPSELSAFTAKTRIREISFRFANMTCFRDYASEAKVYISLIDDEAFPYDAINEKYSWFEVDLDKPAMSKSIEIPLLDYYYSTGELSFTLPDDGLTYIPGKALLVTVVNEADDALDNSEYPQFFRYNTDIKRAATFCSDRIGYAQSLAVTDYIVSGDGYYSQMTDKNQPCLRLMTDELGTDGIALRPALDENESEAVYYNLQGVRVLRPENGVYIRRTAAGAQKVLVK